MTQIGTRENKLGNLVKYEEGTHIGYCRKQVTAQESSATTYEIGTVLGFDGTDYKISVAGAADGSEVAAAVVVEQTELDAATNTEVAVLYRGPASVSKDALVLDASRDIDTVASELEDLGIMVQTTV